MAQYHSKYDNDRDRDDLKNHEDPRVSLITRIWGLTIPLFALSIPLVAITDGDATAVPVLVALGAAASTMTIWLSSKKVITQLSGGLSDEQEHELSLMRRSIVALSEQVTYLEQRIEDRMLSNHISAATMPVENAVPRVASTSSAGSTNTAPPPPPQQYQAPPPQQNTPPTPTPVPPPKPSNDASSPI